MPNVLIVGGGYQYEDMFRKMGWEIVGDMQEADMVQFTGGADVSPEYYDEEEHPASHCSKHRDVAEKRIFDLCLENAIPMAGICRGGQFLNVMSGGAMWQHVDGHAINGTHLATDVATGRLVSVTSTHHQMMRPSLQGTIIAFAHESSFRECMRNGKVLRVVDDPQFPLDPEVVFYPHTNSLCFQPHPEFPRYDECREYYFQCIKDCLGLQ